MLCVEKNCIFAAVINISYYEIHKYYRVHQSVIKQTI